MGQHQSFIVREYINYKQICPLVSSNSSVIKETQWSSKRRCARLRAVLTDGQRLPVLAPSVRTLTSCCFK